MTLQRLSNDQLAVERARYADQLAKANGDVIARRVAEARLAEIDAELARRQVHPNGHKPHPGNRWPHVDLVALIREAGVTLREKTAEKYVGDHAPKHASKSGECLVVWPAKGRWHCSSCKAGGDAAGWLADLEGLSYAEAAGKLEARFGPAPSRYDNLPWIDAAQQDLRIVSADAWDAIELANEADPSLFRHGNQLVRIEHDEHGSLVPVELSAERLTHVLARIANWYKTRTVKDKNGEEKTIRVVVRPPGYVVKDMLATPEPPLPVLRRIVEVPVFAADGQLQIVPGYHPASRTYYDPAPGLTLPPVSEVPSEADVRQARSLLLDELLHDFPFVSEADRAHAVALFLLPFVRDLIDGPTPLHLVEAPTEGSGKGLLTEVCLLPAVGRRFGTMTAGRDAEEWRKSITSVLRGGHTVVWIDNIVRPIDSGDLAAALTTHTWEDRVLGKSETLRLPVRCVWVATANNPVVSREIMRRCVRIRIDPKVDEPWRRTGFKHENLRAWAWEHRAELVWAALVLTRNWLARGRPAPSVQRLGGYEDWMYFVGGILETMGVPNFLSNLDDFYRTANTEVAAWRAFVQAWWDEHRDTPVLVKQLLPLALEIEGLEVNGKDEKGQTRSLGKLLEKQRDRSIGGYCIVKAGTEHRAIRWRLCPSSPPASSGEFCEFCEFCEFSPLTQKFDCEPGQPEPAVPVEQIAVGWRVQIADGSWHVVTKVEQKDGVTRLHVPSAGCVMDARNVLAAEPPDDEPGPGPTDAPTPPTTGHITKIPASTENSQNSPYILLTDADAVQRALPAFLAAPVLGLDCETTGLDPHRDRLRLIQLATPTRVYLIDAFAVDVGLLRLALESKQPKVLHNAKFDLQFLLAHNLAVKNIFDTMLADQLLRGSRIARGLADLANEHLSQTLDKTEQQADWSGCLTPAMLEYAALDAAVLVPLHEKLAAALKEAGLERVASLENRAVPAIAWLEYSGVAFDTEAWRKLADGALAEKLRLEDELTALAEELAGKNTLFERRINWDAPEQVKRLLAECGIIVPNTTEDALTPLAAEHMIVKRLLEYREVAKRCGTYGLNVLGDVHPTTGRIHADWHQIGADSGRMACTRPNLQNVPRTSAYRTCFKAPAGRALVKADYSQIELRIAAEIAGDQRMLAAYRNGEDLHALTARLVLGKQDVTKEDRQAAKALNFGLIYGMGAETLRQHAASGYGVTLTPDEAKRFQAAFFRAYPGLRAWHQRQPEGEIETRTLAGRRRLKVARYTEKLNTPVQGTGADGLKAALALLWETREQCPSAVPVLAVHDELVIECDERDAETAREWLVGCMRRGMEAFLQNVPVEVEAVIGTDWGLLS